MCSTINKFTFSFFPLVELAILWLWQHVEPSLWRMEPKQLREIIQVMSVEEPTSILQCANNLTTNRIYHLFHIHI